MAEQNNDDMRLYLSEMTAIGQMCERGDCDGMVKSIREHYGKLGLFSSASDFLRMISVARSCRSDKEELSDVIRTIGFEALLVVSLRENKAVPDVIASQVELYKLKNRRYGNSFAECFAIDGLPYAFGHLQEKANRICSLLTIDDEAKEEPILDSYKDLMGYCILTLVEVAKQSS